MKTRSTLELVDEKLPHGQLPVIEGENIVGIQVLSALDWHNTELVHWRYVIKRATRVPAPRAIEASYADDDAYC